MKPAVTLVGDGIENPANAVTMLHAAEMFGAACRFRDTKGLRECQWASVPASDLIVPITSTEVRQLHPRVVAFDNLPGARELYGFRAGPDFAVLVGNERRGLSHEFTAIATDCVQAPMVSRRINCLNVAAAAAVALYYLGGVPVGPMATRRDPATRRPELLLLGAGAHVELGSTIRSAAAFGWDRAFVEDRHQVWFGCDRAVRAEGRAAARRGRNEILLVPCAPASTHAFSRVTVITRRRDGLPLHRASLARGPAQLVVIPDESRVDLAVENWARLGAQVEFAHLQIPAAHYTYHYRLLATIALAEVSRQVGRRRAIKLAPLARPPSYDKRLRLAAALAGQWVRLGDLADY
jgi:hypothetical protein